MGVYSASYTWRALEELFDSKKERIDELSLTRDDELLDDYLLEMVPGDSIEEINASLKALENLAYRVSQTIENDFEVLKEIVRVSPPSVRKIFTPSDCRKIITAFEASRTPEVDRVELVIGVYLVLSSGQEHLKNFDVLDILIDAETPSIDEYSTEIRKNMLAATL